MKTDNNEIVNPYVVPGDILLIFKFAEEINWKEIRQASIYRILYIASVLFSFRIPEKENPFRNYKFAIDNSGPYDTEIIRALHFLVKDEYLIKTSGDDVYQLGNNTVDKSFYKEVGPDRADWIKHVIFILGQYGEGKIYDFIFRDPQYQYNIKSNTLRSINTDENNESVTILKKFQKAFEEQAVKSKLKLTSQRYLELYFEYVFSKILKRED